MKITAGTPADELELPFTPPFDWARMLRFFGGRSTGGVETVDGDRYIRTLHWQGAPGLLTVRKDPTRPCLIARVEGEASRHLADMAPRFGHLFDLHTNPQHLREAFDRDPWLRRLVAQAPGLRIPGAWSGFELVVRTIVGQQVSVKAATTIVGRLVQRAGAPAQAPFHPDTAWLFPTPAALADANLEKIGMPGKRVETLQAFARAVAEGVLDIDAATPDVPALRKGLLALKGIGPWTVEYVAMRAWRDADAWPGTDLVLMQAIARRETPLDTETWRPWRAYAAMHLWNEIADSAGMAKGG